MNRLNNITKKPWGNFQNLAESKGWHLKVLIIKKGRRLSLQRHAMRSELWIIAEGRVQVRKGKEVFIMTPKKSTFIKKKEVHRIKALSNSVVVELSFGVHQEKDIVRLANGYGRSKKNNPKQITRSSKGVSDEN